MMSEKIAIIGSNSFLMKSFLKILPGNYKIDLYGRRITENVSYNYINFDYPVTHIDYNELIKADYIILAAAAGVQAKNIIDSDIIYLLNTFLPIQILNFLSSNGYKGKIMTFGSYFEIGNNNVKKYFTEDEVALSPLLVPNHYCTSKRILTRFIQTTSHNLNHYHFIIPTIYGPGENSNRLIPYLINSITNDTPINLTGGSQVRQYLFVDDLAELLLDIIRNPIPAGIYNVIAKEEYSVKQLVEVVFKFFNKPVNVNFGSIKRDDVSMEMLLLDSEKLQLLSNWRPKLNVIDVIETYLL